MRMHFCTKFQCLFILAYITLVFAFSHMANEMGLPNDVGCPSRAVRQSSHRAKRTHELACAAERHHIRSKRQQRQPNANPPPPPPVGQKPKNPAAPPNVINKAFSFVQPSIASMNASSVCPYNNIPKPACSNSSNKYYSYDGSCNNLVNPLYGRSDMPFKRFLPPAYADGVNAPRTRAASGKPLANPRAISLNVSVPQPQQRLERSITELFPIFGQFLAHDITGTSAIVDANGYEKSCTCGSSDPDCALSVPWPSDDPQIHQTCMNFTRSSSSFPFLNCSFAYREQLNLLTPFIDGSQVYGIDSNKASQLRTFRGGMLATSPGLPADQNGLTARTYLPLSNDTCSLSNSALKCFAAGEYRTSENLGLVSMHTLFNREHNRIAARLAAVNPKWDDNLLYFETRRIVIAELQHVVYNEWLPVATGDSSLKPLSTNSYFTGYDSSVNPALTNEFATAALRMGHSLVRQKLSRYDAKQNQYTNKSYDFETVVFQSDLAYDSQFQGLNSILVGLTDDLAWKFGSFGFDLQNNLFHQPPGTSTVQVAVDLLATNINRGRDHGLQPYIYYVKKCTGKSINGFNDLATLMNGQSIAALQTVYESVADIDLYVGGLLENNRRNDASYVLGPTYACLLTSQFSDLKKGDRFYYENGPSTTASAFTLAQLSQIKSVTIAGLICANYDVLKMQPNAFYDQNTPGNGMIDCSQLLNQLNLSAWSN